MLDHRLAPVTTPLLRLIRDHYNQKYTEAFGQKAGKGFYSSHDWRRIEHALGLIDPAAASVLDVGVGPGAMLNYLQLSGRYRHVSGIDIRRYSKLILLDEATDYRLMDVTAMDFPDRSFDTVICMEVLEHLTDDALQQALAQLRRVYRRQLIMSVPFEEPEPLPAYHHQRFDRDRLRRLFPGAEIHRLQRPGNRGWPWAIITETKGDAQ